MGPNSNNRNIVTVPCGGIVIEQLDRLHRTTELPLQDAAIDGGKELYLGRGFKYKTKARDWTAVHASEREIVLEEWKKGKQESNRYTLTPVPHATVKQREQWTALGAKLTKMMARYSAVVATNTTNTAADIANRKFANSNLLVHSPSRKRQLQKRQRGRFGSAPSNRIYHHQQHHPPTTAAPPWDAARHTFGTSAAAGAVHPVSVPRTKKGRQKRLRAQQQQEERFSDDDDDDENLPEAEHYYDDAPEPEPMDEADDDDDDNKEAEAAANDDEFKMKVDAPSGSDDGHRMPKAAKAKHRLLMGKRRLAKSQQAYSNEDSSDTDDSVFDNGDDKHDMTTPAAARFVSPRETSRIKKAPPRTASAKPVVDGDDGASSGDDDDDEEEEKRSSTKGSSSPSKTTAPADKQRQTDVSKYFAPKSSTSVPTTPPRHHSVQSARMSQALWSSRRKKKSAARTEAAWLDLSPTRKKDPEARRCQELFGRALASSSSTSPSHQQQQDDDDDIEESPMTPTRKVRSLVRHSFKKNPHSLLQSNRGKRRYDHKGLWHQHPHRGSFAGFPSNKSARLSYHGSAMKQFGLDSNDNNDMTHTTKQQQQQRFRGLRNLKNTCYQNASLQMLYTCRSFMARLRQQQQDGRGGDLTRAVCRVASELDQMDANGDPANARAVKVAMDSKTDKFLGYDQHDAHEFLSDLVDHVHEELELEKNDDANGEATSKPTTDPTGDFSLTVQVCLKCQSCGYSRTKDEMYRHLSIDIVKEKPKDDYGDGKPAAATASPISICEASVESSLAKFFQPEMREIKCEKCDDGTHAEQTLHILSRPKILLLHLKRFIVEERRVYATENEENENRPPNGPAQPISVDYICKKDSSRIKMPLRLTLDAFQVPLNVQAENTNDLSSEAEDTQASYLTGKDYSLKSIVYHTGTRASSGHYFADALRRDVVDGESAATARGQDSGEASGAASGAAPSNKTTQDAWYCFDDTNSFRHSSGEAITQNRYRQENAYMLLYSLDDNSVEECAAECAAGCAVATACTEAGSFPINQAVEENKAAGTTWGATSAIAKGGPVEAQTADCDTKVEATASSAATLSKTLGAVAGSKLEDATVVDSGAVGALDTVEEAKPDVASAAVVVAEQPFGAIDNAEQCKSKDTDSLSLAHCEPVGAQNTAVTEKASETETAGEPLEATYAAEGSKLNGTSSKASAEGEPLGAKSTVKESNMASDAVSLGDNLGAPRAADANMLDNAASDSVALNESMAAKSAAEESKLNDLTSEAVGAGESFGAPSANEANMLDDAASETAAANEAFGANDSVEESMLDDTACT